MTTYRRRSVADMLADPRPIAGGDGTLTKEQIDNIVSAHGAGIRKALEDSGTGKGGARAQSTPNRPPIYPNGGRVRSNEHDSVGDAFIASEGYRGWVDRFPSGGPSGPGEYRSDPVEIPLSMQDASKKIKARSLFTLSETSGGALSDTQFAGLLAGGLVRPPQAARPVDRDPGRE